MKYFSYRKKGFTIIETLVAVSVLLIALTAVFAAAKNGLASSTALKNRIVATYLAEEAVDGVKNLKDTNLLNILVDDTTDWLDGISECSSSSPCAYDVLDNNGIGTLSPCSVMDGCKVKNGSYGGNPTLVYRQSSVSDNNASTVETGFVRRIWVEETTADMEAKVTVEITRPDQSSFNSYRIETFIYNYWPTL